MIAHVTFPPVVPLLRTILLPLGSPVGKRFRPDAGAQFTIRDDGGTTTGVLQTRTIGINAWHPVDAAAETLANTAQSLLAQHTSEQLPSIRRGLSPVEVTDEEDTLARLAHYYLTVTVLVRGTEA